MAIKGKKKSQARGSQGQRRPGAAPRPAYTGHRKVYWWQTALGRLVAAIVGLVALGVILVLAAGARERAQDTAERGDALDGYTSDIRAAVQPLSEVVSQLQAVPATSDPRVLEKLGEDAGGWIKSLQEVTTNLGGVVPPGDAEAAHALFLQAVGLYTTSADQYQMATRVEGEDAQGVLAGASGVRDQATGVFEAAIAVLDDERDEVDLDPSGLNPPGGTPQTLPTDLPTELPTDLPTDLPTELPTGAPGGGKGGAGDGGGKDKGAGGG